jgi:hypothetical protein
MAGLGFPRDVCVEAYLDGWVDISTSTRQTTPITVKRGRADEQGKTAPSELTLALNNEDGRWTPGNPMSDAYGLWGLNTPMRMSLNVADDSFARTVADGWGADYVAHSANSSIVWAVNGAAATMSVSGTSSYVKARRVTPVMLDGYLRADVSLGFTDITGGVLEPTLTLREIDEQNYYMMRVVLGTAEQVQLEARRLRLNVDTIFSSSPLTVPGLTHSSAQTLRMAGMIEGRTVYGKVWIAGQLEPYEWQMIATDDQSNPITVPGRFGIRSGIGAGNTNVKPVVFTYDNLLLRNVRGTGEVVKAKPKWDQAHVNKFVEVKAAGLLNRLKQGKTPVKSSLRRAYESSVNSAPPVAYWPAEDGRLSTELSLMKLAGGEGGTPMRVMRGTSELATFTRWDSSAPIPVVKDGFWYGTPPSYPATGENQVRFLLSVPSAGITNDAQIMNVITSGSAWMWEILYRTGGALCLKIYDRSGVLIGDTGTIGFTINGELNRFSLELIQNGANVDWSFGVITIDQNANTGVGEFWSGTLFTQTAGNVTELSFGGNQLLGDTSIGHITVQNVVDSMFAQIVELNAWRSEAAGWRFYRLCQENDIPFTYVGNLDDTAVMGPQQVKTILDLLQECVDADQALLYEPRSAVALTFHTRAELYSKAAMLALDYSGFQVAGGLEQVTDNQAVRNDITWKRLGGGEYRAQKLTGPMNVHNPWDDPDGVGRYDDSPTINVYRDDQLRDGAGFALALGTVDRARYPQVPTNMRPDEITETITANILAVNMGDRVDITNMAAADTYEDVDQLCQGYLETMPNVKLHTITFTCSPYRPYRIATLDTTGWQHLDAVATTVNEAVDTTEGAIDTAGELWSTNAANYPVDIMINGERMTLNSVTGAGPQVMNVTRSVNNVVRTHTTGDMVTLADENYLGR